MVATAALAPGVLPATISRALAASAPPGRLNDIEHVVIVIQENRSFDHYFGTYRGVRGFSDPLAPRQSDGTSVFAQPGFAPGRNPDGRLLPFHLDPTRGNADCIFDVAHDWPSQHTFWNGGRMDAFVSGQLATSGADAGPFTMGYYTRAELSYFHALADAFTICDGYHCSVLGATDPNRLYAMTATLDPDGRAGGPALNIPLVPTSLGALRWTTMPYTISAAPSTITSVYSATTPWPKRDTEPWGPINFSVMIPSAMMNWPILTGTWV
jgi:phospholipase C